MTKNERIAELERVVADLKECVDMFLRARMVDRKWRENVDLLLNHDGERLDLLEAAVERLYSKRHVH